MMTYGTNPESPVRHSYDRLDVVRLGTGEWSFQRPSLENCPDSVLLLHVVRGGATLRDGSQTIELGDGELILLASSMPDVVVAQRETDLVVLRISESMLGRHRPSVMAVFGQRISTDHGTASLVANLVRALGSQEDTYSPSEPGRLAQHVIGLVGLMCSDRAGEDLTITLLKKATAYIEEHLADPELTPDRVAAAVNISTRTLHRAFESHGLTVNGWARARRLEQCRLDIVDRRYAHESVSAVGARWGLWDASHFSRVFKANFGLAPRAYRLAALAGTLDPSDDMDEMLISA